MKEWPRRTRHQWMSGMGNANDGYLNRTKWTYAAIVWSLHHQRWHTCEDLERARNWGHSYRIGLVKLDLPRLSSGNNEDHDVTIAASSLGIAQRRKKPSHGRRQRLHSIQVAYSCQTNFYWVLHMKLCEVWVKKLALNRGTHGCFLSWQSSYRTKHILKPIDYAKKGSVLDLSKGSYLLLFICHERPFRRWSKWIQALITLQGE